LSSIRQEDAMISDQMFVLLMALMKFGLVFFIGFRELWILRRLRDRDERDPPHEPLPAPPLPDAGPARKLPDGLVPSPEARPARPRELEPV
jgi:hypothetical protein